MTSNVIRVSKSGVFSLEKFIQLYQKHDMSLNYEVFDALRNRFDDKMIDDALLVTKDHKLKTLILVSVHEDLSLCTELQRNDGSASSSNIV